MSQFDSVYYSKRIGQLIAERSSWISHWKDLNEHILPRQARFQVTGRNRGDKRNNRINDNTATLSARTLASGMMSGLTSPARPWFALRAPDPDLNEYQPVKIWLDTVRQRMTEIFLKSNLYTTLPLIYGDLGVYGTSACLVLEDDETLIRFYHFPIGSYCLASSARGMVDVCYREFMMTVRNMVEEFGLANCSQQVQSLYQNSQYETWITVTHVIEPNRNYNPKRKMFSAFKKFKSCYFEGGFSGSDADTGQNAGGVGPTKYLRESGFDQFRVLAPRWTITGEDIYGASPGMECLGDIRQLQLQQRRKQQLIDKAANPPMGAPSSLREDRASLLPGDVTYYDVQGQGQKLEPLYVPNLQGYQWLLQDIGETQNRIKRGFFEDLFLMIANDTRSGVTAREIAEKHEEKLLALGPVIERSSDELLDPKIDITYAIMQERGIVPKPPPELQGKFFTVQYISILAQAAKLLNVTGIERYTQFTGSLGAIKPEALDWLNVDEIVPEYADAVGVSPKLVTDSKMVAQIRQQRAQQQQMQQLQMAAQSTAEGAKTLSQANMTDDNALTRMMGQFGGQPGIAGRAAA